MEFKKMEAIANPTTKRTSPCLRASPPRIQSDARKCGIWRTKEFNIILILTGQAEDCYSRKITTEPHCYRPCGLWFWNERTNQLKAKAYGSQRQADVAYCLIRYGSALPPCNKLINLQKEYMPGMGYLSTSFVRL